MWVFPKVAVCLECGFTEFTIPERELSVLVHGTLVEGVIVVEGLSEKGSRSYER